MESAQKADSGTQTALPRPSGCAHLYTYREGLLDERGTRPSSSAMNRTNLWKPVLFLNRKTLSQTASTRTTLSASVLATQMLALNSTRESTVQPPLALFTSHSHHSPFSSTPDRRLPQAADSFSPRVITTVTYRVPKAAMKEKKRQTSTTNGIRVHLCRLVCSAVETPFFSVPRGPRVDEAGPSLRRFLKLGRKRWSTAYKRYFFHRYTEASCKHLVCEHLSSKLMFQASVPKKA